VIPAAITEIGGRIEHFGMPVDPGNLLLIGSANGVPVLGAPGCARSPGRKTVFDWVLMRLLAGLKVTRAELTGMGVGRSLDGNCHPAAAAHRGRSRSQPATSRQSCLPPDARRGWAAPNKLLAEIDGKKLVRIVTEQALASRATRPSSSSPAIRPILVEAGAGGTEREIRPQPGLRRRGWASSVKARHISGV